MVSEPSTFAIICSSPGRLRPRPRASVWYYRYIGRYRSLTTRGLGHYVGRMKGSKKVFKCASRANKMGYRAFALRNRGDCYVSRNKGRYSPRRRVFGRFRSTSGGPRVIDAYVIGKGKTVKISFLICHQFFVPKKA